MMSSSTRETVLNVAAFVALMGLLFHACQTDTTDPASTIQSRTVGPADTTHDLDDP